jgi:CheY-like chemotaxis protein
MLPGIDGRAIWQWIRVHRPSLADGVVFMTGDISAASQQFLQESARPVLTKPLAMDRIGQSIAEVLADASARVPIGVVQPLNGHHRNGQGETA